MLYVVLLDEKLNWLKYEQSLAEFSHKIKNMFNGIYTPTRKPCLGILMDGDFVHDI